MSENDSSNISATTSQNGVLEGSEMRPPTVTLVDTTGEEKDTADGNEADRTQDGSTQDTDLETKPAKVGETNEQNPEVDDDKENEEDAASQLRPKTVTLKSTDEHKQRLVDIGAVSCEADVNTLTSNTATNQTNPSQPAAKTRPMSPRPKSEKCYICGKDFLMSSLKVHEKQCAKKQAKVTEKQSILDAQNCKRSMAPINAQKPGNNFVSKIPRKLKLETCYLCGKEFFAHSLGVHETQCIKIWKADKTPDANETSVTNKIQPPASINKNSDENSAPVASPVYSNQDKQTKDDSSQESTSPKAAGVKVSPKMEKKSIEAKQKVLKTSPCSGCGMQFLAHSLKIHEKKCRANKEALTEERSSTENADGSEVLKNEKEPENPKVLRKPRTVVCYICGQEFLKSSYVLHEKQCAAKSKAATEQEASKSENNQLSKTTRAAQKNDQTRDSPARKPKTQKCYLCGKEMLLSSWKIHEQQCQKKQEILKNINQQNSLGAQKPQTTTPRKAVGAKPKTEVCYVCGESFLSSSIKVHEMQCEKKSNANRKMKT